MFRAGSTYCWNKFRCDDSYYCYYEPLNSSVSDSLHELKPHVSRAVAQHMRHPEVSQRYFNEYPRNAEGYVPFYKKEFVYGCQPRDGQASDELQIYLDSLIDHANRLGRRPVLEFCRTAYLQDWLSQNYAADNIFILRSARDQWESYLSFSSGFFTGHHLLMLAKNKDSSLLQPLQDAIYLPDYSSDAVIKEIEFYHCTMLPLLGLERAYFLFYYLWLLTFLEGLHYCRLVFDINGLSYSNEIRRNCERRLLEMNIDLDFSDCRIAQYQETHLTSEQMQRIEGDAERLVSASFPTKIAAAKAALDHAKDVLLPEYLETVERLHSLSHQALSGGASQNEKTSSLVPPQYFLSREEVQSGALETLFQRVVELNELREKYEWCLREPWAKITGRRLRHAVRNRLKIKNSSISEN